MANPEIKTSEAALENKSKQHSTERSGSVKPEELSGPELRRRGLAVRTTGFRFRELPNVRYTVDGGKSWKPLIIQPPASENNSDQTEAEKLNQEPIARTSSKDKKG